MVAWVPGITLPSGERLSTPLIAWTLPSRTTFPAFSWHWFNRSERGSTFQIFGGSGNRRFRAGIETISKALRTGPELSLLSQYPNGYLLEVTRPAVSFPPLATGPANGLNRSSDRRNVLRHDAALEHDAKNSESDSSSSRRMLGPQ